MDRLEQLQATVHLNEGELESVPALPSPTCSTNTQHEPPWHSWAGGSVEAQPAMKNKRSRSDAEGSHLHHPDKPRKIARRKSRLSR
jgi:hypothetical protein